MRRTMVLRRCVRVRLRTMGSRGRGNIATLRLRQNDVGGVAVGEAAIGRTWGGTLRRAGLGDDPLVGALGRNCNLHFL